MPLVYTPDRRYLHAVTTEGEGDGNDVVYDLWSQPGQMIPCWDKFSYEAGLGAGRPPVVLPPVDPTPPVPVPVTPPPEPTVDVSPLAGGLLRTPIQVTHPSDGEFVNRQYAYWSTVFVVGTRAFVFAGHVDGRPRFFDVDLRTGASTPLGSLIGFTGTGENWYFDAAGWVYLINGPRLMRVSPFTGDTQVVFDISDTYPGCDIWQPHSSDDGRTHSATVRRIVQEGKYPYIATVVARDGRVILPIPAEGTLDESHISGIGRDVIIEENDDMRVINVETRDTRRLGDWEGALAHIDCGPDYIVGEADKPDPGQCALYRLDKPLTPGNKVTLFLTLNMGHVSVKGGRILLSDDTHLSLVSPNGGGVVPVFAHGSDVGARGTQEAYDYQPKANLDPTGRVASYMIHRDGRFDLFLAVLPS